MNKLENQDILLEYKKFNLSESITNQILNFESVFEDKQIKLECNIEEDLYLYSNEGYLEIIWNNLISNACKFTDESGNIKIELKRINNYYVFTISDDGCGMSNETGKHIFNKFYQGDTSHHKEGDGLGLALVKKVIDILGGEISVSSQLGVGTTFKVVLKEKF